jgi:molybdopterin converting factor small subunit
LINVKCLGHIGTSVGSKELTLELSEIEASELVEKVRGLSREADPGFTRYNTIILVEDGEAFVPAGASRTIRAGENVALIPFSHGG